MIQLANIPRKSSYWLFTILLSGLFLFTTCDDRIPTDSGKKETTNSDTYTLKVTAQPFYRDAEGNSYSVGEDLTVVGTYTLVIAQLLDSLNTPVAGKLISFDASVGGNSFGSFDVNSTVTDADGLASAVFNDGGQSAYDVPATATYEGVTVTASYVFHDSELDIDYLFEGDVRFDVFDTSEVDLWPYRFRLLKDTDVINMNIDTAKAVISAKLTTKIYGRPMENLEVFFESNKGSLSELSALTDSAGYASVDFRASGDPEDVGVTTITARYQHPVFGMVSDSVQVSIIDTTFSGCPAYIEIPPAHPGEVMIVGGGGIESTDIEARVYDENGVLVDTPIKVTFTLGPEIPMGANLNNVGPVDTAYTVNGVATVSLNSGTAPGPVRVTARVEVSCDSTDTTISATGIPAIIVTGPPNTIFPDVEYTNITPIGGGFYTVPVATIVYDIWNNPVADSTYVYWTMRVDTANDADGELYAEIIGVSFTGNMAPDGNSYPGVAWTTITYPSRDIFSVATVGALCFGANGDSVYAEVENSVVMPYYAGVLLITPSSLYWDFSLFGNPATIDVTATLLDYYNNPVENGRILFSALGASAIYYPFPPIEGNIGVTNASGQCTVTVEYDQGICAPIPNTDPQIYEDFTSYVSGFLLDPQNTSSDPVEILLVRTYQGTGR